MTEQEYLDIITVLNDIRIAVTARHELYKKDFFEVTGRLIEIMPLVTNVPEYNPDTAEADVCAWIQGTNIGYINPFAHVVTKAPVRPQHQRPNETNMTQIIDGVKHMAKLTNEMMQSTNRQDRLYRLASIATILGVKEHLEDILKLIEKL